MSAQYPTFSTGLVVAASIALVSFATTGLFNQQTKELSSKVYSLEISDIKKTDLLEEIIKRLDRIEKKLDSGKKF